MGSDPPTDTLLVKGPLELRVKGQASDLGRQMPLSLGTAGWPDLGTCQMMA